jgi:hypothetical protein
LWSREFNTFHGKVNLLRERRGGLPAVSVGFVARTQVRNVGGVLQGQDTHNQDFYVVATKTITRIRWLPLVFNGGVKATNASLLGLAGNAPGYSARGFGAAGFAFKGPGRSTILLGSEVLQEPREIEGPRRRGHTYPITVRIVLPRCTAIHGWGGIAKAHSGLRPSPGGDHLAWTCRPGINSLWHFVSGWPSATLAGNKA